MVQNGPATGGGGLGLKNEIYMDLKISFSRTARLSCLVFKM